MPLSRYCDACQVLTLGSAQESWRTVNTKHKHLASIHTGRCIKGVIYYLADIYPTGVCVIMSFDVRYEKFSMIELPSVISKDRVMTYDGKLACLDRRNYLRKLWILEDAENHKWSSHDSISLPVGHFNESLHTCFNLTGCTHAGEFVFVPSVFGKSFYVLFWDPVRNSFRRFVLEGIVDDESLLNNGVQDGSMYALHACPNHIDSQMSLL
ncbi:unnamed protein product [Microthlaspi erraticum]|uniref:F-box associated beta-propeller type 3 domain-containing protein n=1 Tax=Microthlaspi erraticum TaxID=1685480 RepID=A0A6D2HVH4_9BRAS|nr:unnamed protein product [Microthlaspi erraticum]